MSNRVANRLAKALIPDEHLSNMRSLRETLATDGAGVKAKAIPTDVLTALLPFSVSGSITAGPSIAQQWAMPTRVRIRLVRAIFKTAPASAQQISLMAAGSPIVVVALPSGTADKSAPASVDVDAGTLMEIKASASTGSNLSVSVWYEPITG